MRLEAPGRPHLTYCTNIHPGETWAEVRRNLEAYVVPTARRVAGGRPFGVGLRLSGVAAAELARADELDRLRDFLAAHDLYVFTINGFPYGPFHGTPVKEQVYLPDWLDPERIAYTNRLADLLAALLPDGVDGTISTVPGAFAPRVSGDDVAARIAAAIATHAAHLHALREGTGKRIALAIEPEPWCHLETTAQAVDFFERHLFGPPGIDALARATGLAPRDAESVLREHVGICLDTCHMAVEFEDPAAALDRLDRAGIRVAKVQISAGLRIELAGDDVAGKLARLRAFADDVYLHQVVERTADGRLVRYLDLPDALRAAEAWADAVVPSSTADASAAASTPGAGTTNAAGDGVTAGNVTAGNVATGPVAAATSPGALASAAAALPREWRVHFHVPLFRERYGPFEGTQPFIRELLGLLRDRPRCDHFEVETYTWSVLPDEFRGDDIVAAVARELEWAAAVLMGEAAPTVAASSE